MKTLLSVKDCENLKLSEIQNIYKKNVVSIINLYEAFLLKWIN